MTSRERVLTALNHVEPDRVPLDLGSTFVTGIAATTLDRLRHHLRLEDRPVKVYDAFQMLGEVEMDLVERFELDVLAVEPPVVTHGLRREGWKPWTLMDGTPVLVPGQFEVDPTPTGDWLLYPGGDRTQPPCARMPKDGYYFDSLDDATWHMDWEPPSLEEVRRTWGNPHIRDEDLAFMADHARLLRRETDKALILGSWWYTGLGYVGSLTDFWTLLARDPGYVKKLFAISAEGALVRLQQLWDALGEDVDLIAISGLDFGTQRSEWFRPEVFREVYLPPLKAQFDWIHQHTTWKIFEHSCGSLANILGDLVGAGLDVLNPVQTSAAGMDAAGLKQRYGNRLSFWGGGVDTQSTLPFGSPAEVRADVIERLRTFAPGGGFVFNPIHNIQPNTPPENILAAYETAREYGVYPIKMN
jgi:hypothetical protein